MLRIQSALGRSVLTAFVFTLFFSMQSMGQATVRPTSAPAPRLDVDVLYSYLGIHSTVTSVGSPYTTNEFSRIPYGVVLGSAYYLNRNWGAAFEYDNHLYGSNDGVQTVEGGIVYRQPHPRWTPFGHVLAGGTRLGGPNDPHIYLYHDYTWGPAYTAGGGLDYKRSRYRYFAVRLIQVDYEHMHAVYPNDPSGGVANVNTYRISSGIDFTFGHIF